jgi:hypothetical protein
MSTVSKQAKAQESHLGNLLTQYMYAVIKDHNGASDRLDPFKSILYQTYDNLMRKKDDPQKTEGTESRFSIQTEVKQHLAFILRACGTEIGKLELTEGTKTADIITALVDTFMDDSVVASFLQLGVTYYQYCGQTLKGSVDESNWIQNQIIGMLPSLKTKLHLVAEITTAVDRSLRVCAWFLGRSVWFGAEKSISSEVFINTLAVPTECTYSLNTLDLIAKDIRAKVVRTKTAKTAAKTEVTAESVSAAVAAAGENTVTAGEATTSVATANNVSGSSTAVTAVTADNISNDIAAALTGI